MKFSNWILILATLGFTWNAQATRSRMTALGQSSNGSLFIEDGRNIFLNPAIINNLGQKVNLEWGEQSTNLDATPRAEGGLVHSLGNLNYGLQLGREGEAAQDAAAANNYTGVGAVYPQNSVELIVGGEGGMKWGGSVLYVNSDRKTSDTSVADSEGKIWTFKGGMDMGAIQGFAHIDLTNELSTETSGVTAKYEGNLTFRLGGSYALNADSKLGLIIGRQSYDFDNGAGSRGEAEDLSMRLDWFRTLKKTDSDMLFYSVGLRYQDAKQDYSVGGISTTQEVQAIPLAIGVESKVKEWMLLRGSVTQEVVVNKSESKDSASNTVETNNADDTVVAAGVGFEFKDFVVDATFSGSTNGTGNFDSTNMFGNIGMTYGF